MISLIKELKAPMKSITKKKSTDQSPEDPEDKEELEIEVYICISIIYNPFSGYAFLTLSPQLRVLYYCIVT